MLRATGLSLVFAVCLAVACGDAESSFPGGQTAGGAAGSAAGTAGSQTHGGAGGSAAGGSGAGGNGAGGNTACTTAPNCSGCKGCLLGCVCNGGDVDSCTTSCTSGTGGSGAGGSGAQGGSAAQGGSGAGGSGAGGSGAGGSGAQGGSGAGGGMGTCNPAFCPNSGFGTPCCVMADGPCGYDTGMGCSQIVDDV